MALIKKQLAASFTDDVGNAVAEAIVTARLTRPDQDDGEHISPTTQTWRADANGDVTLELWPNTRGEADSAYHIRARDPETGRYVYDQVVVMPELDTTLDAITDLAHEVPMPIEGWQAVTAAREYRDTADNHATTAQRYASEDEDTTVVDEESGADTGTFSSRHHRNKSEQAQAASESARDASQSARDASQAARDDSNEHATTSERWATETGGTVVDEDSGADSGEYSAKEYAQGSQAGTGGSSKNWAQKVGAAVVSGLYSAKEWAVGTFTRGTAGGGSAKDWATLTGQTVDDAAYSAREHAQGDVESHGGSARAWAIDASSPDASGEKSAKTLAGEASTSADNAATYESGAQNARDTAESHRDAAQTARDGAESAESSAQQHRDDAQTARDKSQAWATGTEPGGAGTKSAEEWAGEAAATLNSKLDQSENLGDVDSASLARDNLGLGSAATKEADQNLRQSDAPDFGGHAIDADQYGYVAAMKRPVSSEARMAEARANLYTDEQFEGGASGTFDTPDGRTVTVEGGLIIDIS